MDLEEKQEEKRETPSCGSFLAVSSSDDEEDEEESDCNNSIPENRSPSYSLQSSHYVTLSSSRDEIEPAIEEPQSPPVDAVVFDDQMTRKSSLHVMLVEPYFRLAILIQPLLDFLLAVYANLDSFITLHLDLLLDLMSLLLVFFGVMVTFYGRHVSKTLSFLFAFRNERLWSNLMLVRSQIRTSKKLTREMSISNSFQPLAVKQTKKMRTVLSKLDPHVVSDIVADCWRSILFAGATAKLNHAKTISLGLVLGDHLNRPVQRHFVPLLGAKEDFSKWYVTLFAHLCSLLGVLLAFQLAPFKILGLISTSVKGAHMILDNVAYLRRIDPHEENREELSVGLLILVGIAFQTYFVHIPLLLQIVWFPVFFLENWLIDLVEWI